MILEAQYRRLSLLAFFMVITLSGLSYRLFDLQILRHDEFSALADKKHDHMDVLEPLRGQILDIRGNPLATSSPAKVVYADPSLIGARYPDVARALAPILGTNEEYLLKQLTPKIRPNGTTNQYAVLARKVSLDKWQAVKSTMTNLSFGLESPKEKKVYDIIRYKAIRADDDQIRNYPNTNLAAHVIGFVDKGETQNGLSGIEAVFNEKLAGTRGWRKTEVDVRRHEIVPLRDQDVAPRNGLNVVLTIDAGLQHIVETELEKGMLTNNPISVSCIVVRPRTGEILAMATLPNYDPNVPEKYTFDVMRNRVICDGAEPGSTFKIVPVSGALNDEIVHLSDVFNCEHGRFAYGGKILHDHEPYDMLSVQGIIMKSSNIGAAKVAMKLGENELYSYIRNYGFGKKTGISLPGEINGIVHPVSAWTKVSIAQIPMGQGVFVTPLQTVMAMSAIANKGLLMRPMLVDRLVDENGKIVAKYEPGAVRQVISEAAAKEMVTALKTVPTKEGTAELAKMEHYTVAGKTGTAQKVENKVYVQKFFTSFIGFFPADNPELCISVVFDAPSQGGHYGGRVAGPVFKAIAERAANYLNIKPDIEPQPEPDVTSTMATITAGSARKKGGKN